VHVPPLRVALAVPLLAIGFGTASVAARVGPAAPLCAQAASAHHAGIVVELGDGQVLRQCVGFDSATVTALAVLQGSGIEYATAAYGSLGVAVCQIDNEPTSYTDCLPSSGSYWVFFISRGGGPWANSSQGISNTTVSNGDDVGFRYDPLAGADPAPVSPAGTCATSTPTPSPTAAPTLKPTPKPTPAGTAPPGGTSSSTPPPQGTKQPAPTQSSAVEPVAVGGPATTPHGTGQPSAAASVAPVSDVAPTAAISGPFTPGLLLAALAVVALLGLAGLQGIRRRHR
jgi:hypothetical protein